MASKPHSLGPWSPVVGWLYDSEGWPYTLLECGHAVRYHQANEKHMPKPKRRSCALCEDKRELAAYRLKRCVQDVEAARVEGKRLRLLAHYKAKGEEPPEQVRKRRCRIALFETREEIPQ